jgi:hypothetical protein
MNFPSLSHSVNSSGRLGMFVQPQSCPCVGCHKHLTDSACDQEPPGLSNRSPIGISLRNFPPPPSATKLERQNGLPLSTGVSPISPLSKTSSMPSPIAAAPLLKRSNGGGISSISHGETPVGLGPTPTGLGDWRALFEGYGDDSEEPDYCGPCDCAVEEDLKDEIVGHLNQYLMMLEKHQKVMAAKLDLYSFLLEDASVRLRLDSFNKKIKTVKETLEKLE